MNQIISIYSTHIIDLNRIQYDFIYFFRKFLFNKKFFYFFYQCVIRNFAENNLCGFFITAKQLPRNPSQPFLAPVPLKANMTDGVYLARRYPERATVDPIFIAGDPRLARLSKEAGQFLRTGRGR